jgi:SecDF, P1 head subdomain
MRRLCMMIASVSFIAACEPADDTLRMTMPACRPPDTEQGILFIGDTRFAPYQVQASAVTDATGRPALSIRLDESGAEMLEAITVAHMGDVVPLRVDDEVIMSPRVLETITGGEILVSGDFELEELKALAVRLSPSCDQESPIAN